MIGKLGGSERWRQLCWLLAMVALLASVLGCTSKEAEQTVQRWVEAVRKQQLEQARRLYLPGNYPANSNQIEADFARALEEGAEVKYETVPGIDAERATVVIHITQGSQPVRWIFRVEKSSSDKAWRILSMRRYSEGE